MTETPGKTLRIKLPDEAAEAHQEEIKRAVEPFVASTVALKAERDQAWRDRDEAVDKAVKLSGDNQVLHTQLEALKQQLLFTEERNAKCQKDRDEAVDIAADYRAKLHAIVNFTVTTLRDPKPEAVPATKIERMPPHQPPALGLPQ
jgi:hypothetical protein